MLVIHLETLSHHRLIKLPLVTPSKAALDPSWLMKPLSVSKPLQIRIKLSQRLSEQLRKVLMLKPLLPNLELLMIVSSLSLYPSLMTS
uniref:Uncharacterized protein n=1 Tax=uncultured marine virus TaxID=186617 RepID=A0A0F7LBY3_9VIRU|nr:hypothetical protein [uncultured marine virus]